MLVVSINNRRQFAELEGQQFAPFGSEVQSRLSGNCANGKLRFHDVAMLSITLVVRLRPTIGRYWCRAAVGA